MGFAAQHHMVVRWEFVRKYHLWWFHTYYDTNADIKVRPFNGGGSTRLILVDAVTRHHRATKPLSSKNHSTGLELSDLPGDGSFRAFVLHGMLFVQFYGTLKRALKKNLSYSMYVI